MFSANLNSRPAVVGGLGNNVIAKLGFNGSFANDKVGGPTFSGTATIDTSNQYEGSGCLAPTNKASYVDSVSSSYILTGDYKISFRYKGGANDSYDTFFELWASATSQGLWCGFYPTVGYLAVTINTGTPIPFASTITDNVYHLIELTRVSGVLTVTVDTVVVYTGAHTGNVQSDRLRIGNFSRNTIYGLNGYMDTFELQDNTITP